MTTSGEATPISLRGVSIEHSSVAVGQGAVAGDVSGDGADQWRSALVEFRRMLLELRESGDLPTETADEGLERVETFAEELGEEKPRRTVVLDLVTTLGRAVEGVPRVADTFTHVTNTIRSVFPG